jgi:hypothetical protein
MKGSESNRIDVEGTVTSVLAYDMFMWKIEATVRGPAATDSDIPNSHRTDRCTAVLGLNPSHPFYQVCLHPPPTPGQRRLLLFV